MLNPDNRKDLLLLASCEQETMYKNISSLNTVQREGSEFGILITIITTTSANTKNSGHHYSGRVHPTSLMLVEHNSVSCREIVMHLFKKYLSALTK